MERQATDSIRSIYSQEVSAVELLSPDQEKLLSVMIWLGKLAEEELVLRGNEQLPKLQELELVDLDQALSEYKVWLDFNPDLDQSPRTKKKDPQREVNVRGALLAYANSVGQWEAWCDEEQLTQLSYQGQHAYNHLVSANLRLVLSQVNRYYASGEDFMDLVQAGNLGLMIAVANFEFWRKVRFSTYAHAWIKNGILRHIAKNGRTIRLSNRQVGQIRSKLRDGDPLSQAEELADLQSNPLSLDYLAEYSETPILETLQSEPSEQEMVTIKRVDEADLLDDLIEVLDNRSVVALIVYYNLRVDQDWIDKHLIPHSLEDSRLIRVEQADGEVTKVFCSHTGKEFYVDYVAFKQFVAVLRQGEYINAYSYVNIIFGFSRQRFDQIVRASLKRLKAHYNNKLALNFSL